VIPSENARAGSEPFECEDCHELVQPGAPQPTCSTCGATYQFDSTKAAFALKASRLQGYNLITLLLLIVALAGLFTSRLPASLSWLFAFVAFAVHYWNALHCGVISSRLFIHQWPKTVYRAESPNTFLLAMVIEGFWVIVLLICLLSSVLIPE
jgi:hypothetical protein